MILVGKPEGIIEDYLGKLAKEYGFLYYKFTSPANAGVPDRCLVGHGMTFFVELKKPGGHTQKIQDAVFSNIRRHGGIVYIVDSKSSARALLNKLVPNYQPKKPNVPTSNKFKIMSV